jgi:hypothetical protein
MEMVTDSLEATLQSLLRESVWRRNFRLKQKVHSGHLDPKTTPEGCFLGLMLAIIAS